MLYVDQSGDTLTPPTDLATISGWDDGLSIDDSTGDISYNPQNLGFAPSRLFNVIQLSNSDKIDVAILGTDENYVTTDGKPIMNYAGVFYVEPTSKKLYHVIYDTTQCNGDGYYVYDLNGAKTAFPNAVLLFHELAHAYHEMKGDAPSNANDAEIQATNDENQLRNEYALPQWLPARDPGNHGLGCGYDENLLQQMGCYIATASSEPADLRDIQALRSLRDFVIRRCQLGCDFFDQFFAEYYRFSPQVAADIGRREPLRYWSRTLAIGPLVAFLRVLENYVFQGDATDVARDALQRGTTVLSTLSAKTLEDVLDQLAQIRSVLLSDERRDRPAPVTAPTSDDAMVALAHFHTAVERLARPQSRCAAWGLIEPLIIHWRAVGRAADGDHAGAAEAYVRSLAAWFGEIPLPLDHLGAPGRGSAAADLEELVHAVFRPLGPRRTLLERVHAAVGGDITRDVVERLAAIPAARSSRGGTGWTST